MYTGSKNLTTSSRLQLQVWQNNLRNIFSAAAKSFVAHFATILHFCALPVPLSTSPLWLVQLISGFSKRCRDGSLNGPANSLCCQPNGDEMVEVLQGVTR